LLFSLFQLLTLFVCVVLSYIVVNVVAVVIVRCW
jgi:hypothetical protein